ncbi:MAG: hypothetical protein L0Z62_24985 [Gemmataceae bacterium]|nr:hypothetical protein [Gemmataceae bacterium]
MPAPGPVTSSWVPVTGALVQQAGVTRDYAVGRVLVSFDPVHRDDLPLLYGLRNRIEELNRSGPTSADEQAILRLVRDDYVQGQWRRWELPLSFTGRVRVQLCEILLPYHLMPDDWGFEGDRDHLLLPCMGDLDPRGGIKMRRYTPRMLQRRQEQFVRCLLSRGVRLNATLVQANADLYSPGREDLPCLVLITFERDLPDEQGLLRRLADRVYDLKQDRPANEDEGKVSDIVLDSEELAVEYRRRQLPRGFTGGPVVYAADLWIHRPFLPGGHLVSKSILPVVAEPGPQGAIELLPPWDLERTAAEPEEVREVAEDAPASLPLPRVGVAPPPPSRRADEDEEPAEPSGRSSQRQRSPGLLLGGALVAVLVLGLVIWLLWRAAQGESYPATLTRGELTRAGGNASFAVEYQFSQAPDPATRYVLVVRTRRGTVAAQQENLLPRESLKGTMRAVVVGPMAQEGPFNVVLEVQRPGARRAARPRVSNTLTVE